MKAKTLVFALAVVLTNSAFAASPGRVDKLPMLEFMAKSIADENGLRDLAIGYFSSYRSGSKFYGDSKSMFAAAFEGGKALKTWPEDTDPLIGSILSISSDSPQYFINSHDQRKDEFEYVLNKRLADVVNFNSIADMKYAKCRGSFLLFKDCSDEALDIKAPPMSQTAKGIFNGYFFMRNVAASVFASSLFAQNLSGKDVNAIAHAGNNTININAPNDISDPKEWVRIKRIDLEKKIENTSMELANNLAYVALSGKGQPIRFAFKPTDQKNSRFNWAIVEFTDRGIRVETLKNERESFPVLNGLNDYAKNKFLCYSFKPCEDYPIGHFSDKKVFGTEMFVVTSKK